MRRPTVSILGLAASGTAAARLALAHGETVHVSDISTEARVAARGRELELLGADVQLGSHDLDRIESAAVVVVSPGIPPDAPVLRALRARGVRWISEPEFAVRFFQGPLIAVTGTNGKTTTATLTAHLLESSGIPAALGGNVGGGIAPAASELALRAAPPAWYVLEVSSFQLADTERFAPQIGVVTNLAPDHLDRYPDVAHYYADKARLFRNARSTDRWVLNGDDPDTLALPADAPGFRYAFTWDPPRAVPPSHATGRTVPAAFLRGGILTIALPPEPTEPGPPVETPLLPAAELGILGRHNVRNALAASLTARLAGAEPEGIRLGLRSFRSLPHRLEPVGEHEGVLWVNDSKATNVAAARSALESLDRPLVVLLGGKDKGEDFRPLAAALRKGTRAAVLFGAAGPRLEAELKEALAVSGGPLDPPLVRVPGGLDDAVACARGLLRSGDLLLLSPACSSFDEFEDYEARGRRFRALAGGADDPGAAP